MCAMKKFTLLALLACSLYAHPHVFVDAGLTVHTTQTGVESIGVSWTMDEMTSQLFLMDFDANGNGAFEPDEVAALTQESFNHLSDYGYFLRLFTDGREIPISVKAAGFMPTIENHRLVYRFELPQKIPLPLGAKMTIQVADEEGYMAMTLNQKDIRFKGALPPDFSVRRVDQEFYYAWVLDFTQNQGQKVAAR